MDLSLQVKRISWALVWTCAGIYGTACSALSDTTETSQGQEAAEPEALLTVNVSGSNDNVDGEHGSTYLTGMTCGNGSGGHATKGQHGADAADLQVKLQRLNGVTLHVEVSRRNPGTEQWLPLPGGDYPLASIKANQYIGLYANGGRGGQGGNGGNGERGCGGDDGYDAEYKDGVKVSDATDGTDGGDGGDAGLGASGGHGGNGGHIEVYVSQADVGLLLLLRHQVQKGAGGSAGKDGTPGAGGRRGIGGAPGGLDGDRGRDGCVAGQYRDAWWGNCVAYDRVEPRVDGVDGADGSYRVSVVNNAGETIATYDDGVELGVSFRETAPVETVPDGIYEPGETLTFTKLSLEKSGDKGFPPLDVVGFQELAITPPGLATVSPNRLLPVTATTSSMWSVDLPDGGYQLRLRRELPDGTTLPLPMALSPIVDVSGLDLRIGTPRPLTVQYPLSIVSPERIFTTESALEARNQVCIKNISKLDYGSTPRVSQSLKRRAKIVLSRPACSGLCIADQGEVKVTLPNRAVHSLTAETTTFEFANIQPNSQTCLDLNYRVTGQPGFKSQAQVELTLLLEEPQSKGTFFAAQRSAASWEHTFTQTTRVNVDVNVRNLNVQCTYTSDGGKETPYRVGSIWVQRYPNDDEVVLGYELATSWFNWSDSPYYYVTLDHPLMGQHLAKFIGRPMFTAQEVVSLMNDLFRGLSDSHAKATGNAEWKIRGCYIP